MTECLKRKEDEYRQLDLQASIVKNANQPSGPQKTKHHARFSNFFESLSLGRETNFLFPENPRLNLTNRKFDLDDECVIFEKNEANYLFLGKNPIEKCWFIFAPQNMKSVAPQLSALCLMSLDAHDRTFKFLINFKIDVLANMKIAISLDDRLIEVARDITGNIDNITMKAREFIWKLLTFIFIFAKKVGR